jgi:hypothetical protein
MATVPSPTPVPAPPPPDLPDLPPDELVPPLPDTDRPDPGLPDAPGPDPDQPQTSSSAAAPCARNAAGLALAP